MILHINGDISRYYVETLCLVFFPGATFGENEKSEDGVPEVTVNVQSDNGGSATAYVSIKLNDKIFNLLSFSCWLFHSHSYGIFLTLEWDS